MAKEGAGGGPDWNGLLKWSLAHGGDGTTPSRALSDEDRKWFMEAMQVNTIDVVGRMKEIAQVMKTPDDVLQSHGVTTENIEDMLDELQEHVESIDMANDVCRVRVAGRIRPKNADELAQGADFDNIVELQPEVRRRAVVPSLHKRYLSVMVDKVFCKCAERLVEKLETYALSGEPVNMEARFSQMTLDVIGLSLFNYTPINFRSLPYISVSGSKH
ncbi:hypothetical protein QYE76_007231 [Lolium multiflorum]|uniref:Nucleotide exchange factor Fes1 domain-containing protein n=1 Tax=Lolium multiflorum TaxID=4521 RepID=A0AAD8RWG5_LOLMU|nr:hypothetical protein QYE76_007231 [Lolium multiflorum]